MVLSVGVTSPTQLACVFTTDHCPPVRDADALGSGRDTQLHLPHEFMWDPAKGAVSDSFQFSARNRS